MMNLTLKQSGVRWLWLALLVIVLDQLAKLAILNSLPYGGVGVVVTSFFKIVHVYNTGAAFSFLAHQDGWQRWFFATFALVVSGIMAFAMRRQAASQIWLNISYALIVGGALGNLIDRLVYGHVVDFLLFHWKTEYFFPAFNIADCGITVGAAMLVLDGLRSKKSVAATEHKAG
jgi:signal peptidase II